MQRDQGPCRETVVESKKMIVWKKNLQGNSRSPVNHMVGGSANPVRSEFSSVIIIIIKVTIFTPDLSAPS